MQTSVIFKSKLFAPFLPDDAQVNPECYGAELAWWLARKLAENGIYTSYPNYEDWGWFIEYIVDDNEYWLCCGNQVGEKDKWQVFLDPKAKSFFGRNKAQVSLARPLIDALKKILETEQGISEITWESDGT